MSAQKNLPIIEKSSFTPTILIAGGAGFLGSHLAQRLLEKSTKVVVLDNLAQGKLAFISGLLNDKHFTFIECDLNKGLPENIKSVDYIFHLAALESYQFGPYEASLDSLLTNSLGTKSLLDLAKRSLAKFLLASTIDVYQGILSSYDLEHYFGPSEYEEKKFSHLEAKRFSESLVWEYYKKENLNARIARLPEIYGPRMDFAATGNLGRLLQSLTKGEDLVVYGDGLEKEYYIFIDDAIGGLTKAMFAKETEGKIYPLSPTQPITALELTYLVKKFAPPKTQVIFKPEKTKLAFPTLQITDEESLKSLGWKPETRLEIGIRKTLEAYNYKFPTKKILETSLVEQAEKNQKLIPKEEVKIPTSQIITRKPYLIPKILIPLGILLTALFIISLPLLSFGINLYLGGKNLASARESLSSLQSERAAKAAQAAMVKFEKCQKRLRYAYPMVKLLNPKLPKEDLAKLLSAAKYFSAASSYLAQAQQKLARILPRHPPSKEGLSEKDFLEAGEKMENAVEQYLLGLSEIKKTKNFDNLPSLIKIPLEKLEDLPSTENLTVIGRLVKSLPQVLGYHKEQTYLVLFQNSNELRPNGGFIGSLAIITLKEGQIEKLKIEDVYNIDGLLEEKKLYLSAPKPIKKYLKQEKLFLREANFNPDFPKSAETIKNLYLRATGEEAEGVIGVTLDFVKDLLSVTGPIYLAQYNEVIDENNFYERAQYHSEANYFEGSPQKKNFLGTLGEILLEKIFSLEEKDSSKLLSAIQKGLTGKSLLFYFPPSTVRAVFAEAGWDGSIKSTDSDYIYIVEANLGANKANYFVTKTIDYEVSNTNREGRLQGNLKITFIHKGETSNWPGGTYKNYLRILVPENSYLHKAYKEERGKEKLEITKEVTLEPLSGRRSLIYYFELKPRHQLTLSFNYFLPPTIAVKPETKSYRLLLQKQPGAKSNEAFGFKMLKPFGKEFGGNEGMKVSEDSVEEVVEMGRDVEIEVGFKK